MAATHALIEARARRDAWTDADRERDEAAAKQAAFVRYYLQVTEKLVEFEVAALDELNDAGIRQRVAWRVEALEARKNLSAQTRGQASAAAGSIPKALAGRRKADDQRRKQGNNLGRFRRKQAGLCRGLVPNNCEDGFARKRDQKGFFEPVDVGEWCS